jgi:hypothetical protein
MDQSLSIVKSEPVDPGLLELGNIDMSNRPRVTNADGSVSTVRSIGVNVGGKEVLIPTVVGNRVVSNADAIAEYKRTGKHLGVFDTPEHSDQYAQKLHESEAAKLDAAPLTIVKSETTNPVSDSGSLAIKAGAAALPVAAKVAAEIATNPAVPRVAATVGRVVGGVAPMIAGGYEYGMPGFVGGAVGAASGSWSGGKTGWFTGKLAQSAAGPVAKALDVLAPYAQAISTVSGAQGVLDLAQMADKTRTDIGSLGFALDGERSKTDKDAHPALINAVAGKIVELATALKNNGIPAAEATALKLLSDGKAAVFGRLMTAYMRSGEMMKSIGAK